MTTLELIYIAAAWLAFDTVLGILSGVFGVSDAAWRAYRKPSSVLYYAFITFIALQWVFG